MNPEKLWTTWTHPVTACRVAKQLRLGASDEALRTQLPLWEPWLRIDGIKPIADPCASCPGHAVKAAVLPSEGQGTLLVVGAHPTATEVQLGVAFGHPLGQYVQGIVRKHWSGPVTYTHAVRCALRGSDELRADTAAHDPAGKAEACRFHLARTIDDVKPTRIVFIGRGGALALGVYHDAVALRRCWGLVRGVPAWHVMDPQPAMRNGFLKAQFESDLAAVLREKDVRPVQGVTTVLTTPLEVELWLRGAMAQQSKPVAVDVEHDGRLWDKDFRLLCVGLCQDPAKPVVATVEALDGAVDTFREFLADPRVLKVNQNIKHDRHALYRHFGVDMAGIVADTMVYQRLRDPDAPAGLGKLAWYVGFGGYKEAANFADADEDDRVGNKFAALPPNTLHAYNGRDVAVTTLVHDYLHERMGKLANTWYGLLGPGFDALTIVERNGMLLSPEAVRSYDKWLTARETDLLRQLVSIPGVPAGFNPGSTAQMRDLLYKQFRLPVLALTGTKQPSTAKDVLVALQDKHPVVPILLQLSRVRKQRSTYGLGVLDYISPLDGRVHTTFKLVRTGRLSSSDPNLQNCTRPDPDDPNSEGTWARGCYVAPPGYKLVQLDFSQLELRVAAMLSKDRAMAAAFDSGVDFHTQTAALAFHTPAAKVSKKQRTAAKAINFGLLYGKSAYGLAQDLGVTTQEVEGMINSIFGVYTGLAAWRREQLSNATITGRLVTTWAVPGTGVDWTHYRGVLELGDRASGAAADKTRKHLQNVALNTPIQNVATWMALAALTEAVRWTRDERPDVRVVMTVHDSILLEAPENRVDETVEAVSGFMTGVPSGIVKLTVDAEVGDDWGRLNKYRK